MTQTECGREIRTTFSFRPASWEARNKIRAPSRGKTRNRSVQFSVTHPRYIVGAFWFEFSNRLALSSFELLAVARSKTQQYLSQRCNQKVPAKTLDIDSILSVRLQIISLLDVNDLRMTKPNRALKAIDKNSLPKIIDILEVPKARSSKAAKNVSTSEVNGENAGSIPIRPRKRRKKALALSKTPKISNLGGNKNVTTRRGLLATNSRPPMPNSMGSTMKKRRDLGGSVLTPYGAEMARLKSRSGAITPSLSKSPNLKKHYDRLKPIACNLYNQHTKQQQQVWQSKTLLGRISGRNNQDQKTTINSTPSMNRTPNTTMTKLPTTPSKRGGDEKKTIPKETTNELKNTNPNENRNQSDSDDMDCDSSDELSLDSSSSSSPSPSKKTEPSSSLTPTNEEQPRNSSGVQNLFELHSERRHQIVKKSVHDETHANPSPDFDDAATTHLSVSVSPSNANGDNADQKIWGRPNGF